MFLSLFDEIKNYCSASNAKSKGDRTKNSPCPCRHLQADCENQYSTRGLSHLLESLPKELYIIGPTLLL